MTSVFWSFHGIQKVGILKKFVKRYILRDLFEKKYHSSANFDADFKSVLEIKKSEISMPFWEGGVRHST